MLRAHQADLDSLSFILLLARRPWLYVYAIDILINGFHTQRERSRSNSKHKKEILPLQGTCVERL